MVTIIFYFILVFICMPSLTTPSSMFIQNVYNRIPFQKSLVTKDPFFPDYSAISKLQCGALCARNNSCRYFTYEINNSKCSLFHYSKDILSTQDNENTESFYSVDDGDNWNMVYLVKSNKGINVTANYASGICSSSANVKQITANTECPGVYRSALIDIWSKLPIAKVKLVITKNLTVAVSLEFDGRNSLMTDWFQASKILVSPWKHQDNKTVALDLFAENHTFSYRELNGSLNWMIVLSEPSSSARYPPTILYSEKKPFVNYTDGIEADSLGIYINFEEK